MILLIEPDSHVRKKLCDLLPRERIIAIGTIAQTLEMICVFQKRIKLMIVNLCLFQEIVARQTLFRLCSKLCIDIPAILSFYLTGDEAIKDNFEKQNKSYEILKYDEDDQNFPKVYIDEVRKLYPEVIADIRVAQQNWTKREETEKLIDPRKWLEEAGFVDVAEKLGHAEKKKKITDMIPIIEKDYIKADRDAIAKEAEVDEEIDYKKRYFEIKGRYDTLLEYLKDLVDFVKRI